MKYHIAICSINFGKSPEGICTDLLVRALLDAGCQITLITSPKAQLDYSHANLLTHVYGHKPREPRFLFNWIAKLRGELAHPYYMWGRKAAQHVFSSDNMPNVVYGRAWPYSSLIPAQALAKRYNLPLITHLSDPIPPPNEADNHPFLAHLQQLANASAALTFTNDETISYQKNFTQFNNSKAHVLPHIAPVYRDLPIPSKPKQYYYTGAIGNRKSVLAIVIEGFRQHQTDNMGSMLNFVCSTPQDVIPAIDANNASDCVKILPFADDITDIYNEASALISLEPSVKNPIWTLTKTVHYLQTNRKVFALTSPGSPTERMLRAFPESCVVVTEYSVSAIKTGFDRLQSLNPSHLHYIDRFKSMDTFRSQNVAKKLLDICDKISLGSN